MKFHSQNKKIPSKRAQLLQNKPCQIPWPQTFIDGRMKITAARLGFFYDSVCPPEPAVPLKLSQNVTLSHQRIDGVKWPPLAAIFIYEAVKFALCHVMAMLWQQHGNDGSHKHGQSTLGPPFTYRLSDWLFNKCPHGVSMNEKTTE